MQSSSTASAAQAHSSDLHPQSLIRQVFISHTGQDEGAKTFAASILKPALEAAGLKVFMDFRDLPLGHPWPDQLIEAACCSAVVVAVLSSSYTQRFWCMLELDLALHGSAQHPRQQQPLVIPVFYDAPDAIVQVDAIKQHWTARLPAQEQQQLLQQQQQQQSSPTGKASRHISPLAILLKLAGALKHLLHVHKLLQPWRWRRQDRKQPGQQPQQLHAEQQPPQVVQQQQQPEQSGEQQLQPKLLSPDRQCWVDPERWSRNISSMQEQLQNVRISTLPALEALLAAHAKDGKQGELARRVQAATVPRDGQYQLARQVVAAAVAHVFVPAHLQEGLVGFEQQLAELVSQLVVPDPQRLGLWLHGMGGCGKTTMAKLLFNRLSPSFSHRAFVELNPEDGGQELRQHLVTALTALGATHVNTHLSVVQLLAQLCEFVQGKKVLLVLDNVWTAEQLDGLMPPQFGQGSRVMVTSRCGSLGGSLRYQDVEDQFLHHELGLLDDTSAQQLFCHSAKVTTDKLPTQLQELQASIVKACGGLPLALQVAGSQLYKETDVKIWKEVLVAVTSGTSIANKDADAQLRGVLISSFNKLTFVAQNMLLDVVSILHGRSSQQALAIWDTWWKDQGGARGAWKELQRRALVSCSITNRLLCHWELPRGVSAPAVLHVHDVIRSLGRGIICDPDFTTSAGRSFYGSRVWVQEDGQPTQFTQGTLQPLVAISLQEARVAPPAWEALMDTQVTSLHILHAPGLDGWQLEVLHRQLPSQRLLQQLDLRGCKQLSSLPETIGRLTAMQQLDLSGCEQLSTLPESLGRLTALQELGLSGCELRALPESLGLLTAMQQLDLSWCLKLASLPKSLGQLTALQRVNLIGCGKLSSLPQPLGQLTALQWLNLSRCDQLSSLPESLGQLAALQELDLSWCTQLSTLPESLGQLTALQVLDLGQCEQLSTLPELLGQLTALQELVMCECEQLTSLPESLGQLTSLQQLNLSGCKKLSSLPESLGQLTALQVLDLGQCEQLSSLPESLGQLTALQELVLRECERLSSLPESIGQLTALQHLNLSMCKQLTSLPQSLGQLRALQRLYIRCCEQLSSLPESLGQVTALQELHLSWDSQLSSLPESIGQLTALQQLHLSGCKLTSLPGSIEQLTALLQLNLSSCWRLTSLPESIGQLNALQQLDLTGCRQLTSLPESIGQLTALQELYLYGCQQLSSLPELPGQFTALQYWSKPEWV